jgi:hypothetical protein
VTENQGQNKASLLHKQIPCDVRHADKQGSWQCKCNGKLAQPRSLDSIERVALARKIAKREDKEYWQ